ncbi:MAG: acetate--CoA ligase family protein [Nitrospinales bacterium]
MNEAATMSIEPDSASSLSLLEPFFAPKGVAVIGASPSPGNLGKRIVESMHTQGYAGRIIAVHPRGLSLPQCDAVADINNLPEIIDLAIATVSAAHVHELIELLANKGIHNLIVIGGGYAETGAEGKKLQHDIKNLGKRWGVRIVGPNCLGTFSSKDRFNSFFLSANDIQLPGCGSVGIISQSGAFLSAMLDQLARRNLGVHRAINFGNRIDIGECETLEAYAADPEVKVIGVYLESVQNGKRFFELARNISQKKPIIICKGGKTEKGSRAIQSHSASLAGSYSVFQTACKQAGMIEVEGLAELINALQLFTVAKNCQGNRVVIVSNGGGMGVMLADLCEREGCIVEEPPIEIQRELFATLPNYYSLKNPIDLTGSGTNKQCAFILDKLINTGLYDCLLFVILSGTEGINADIASQFQSAIPENFPVIVGAYGKDMYPKLCESLRGKNIPVYPTGEEAAWALNLLIRSGSLKSSHQRSTINRESFYRSLQLLKWLNQIDGVPDEMQLKNKLSECGVQIPKSFPVVKSEDLSEAIMKVGYPVILKVIGKDIQHKTELKGIRSDIHQEYNLYNEWDDMNNTWPGMIWAEEQMPPGLDLMVGMHRDVDFGPVLLFGTGGKYVEVYNDIERIILPAEDEEILQAIFRTRAGQIIKGVREEGPLDFQKLIQFIRLIAEWVEQEPKLLSLDFNPIRLYKNSLILLDAKLKLNKYIDEDET